MARVRMGDVFEIPTDRGVAYAQCTHRHPTYGHLIRALVGLFDARPDDLAVLVRGPARFCTFFPLPAAVRQKIVTLVGNEPIPVEARAFPLFRAGAVDPATGRVDVWWLWDGEREWRVGSLSDAERRLPIRGVWNDTMLRERIVADWTPETDPT